MSKLEYNEHYFGTANPHIYGNDGWGRIHMQSLYFRQESEKLV